LGEIEMPVNVNPTTTNGINFIKIPRALIEEEKYRKMNSTEKIIYGVLLYRAEMTTLNKTSVQQFIEKGSGEMFIYYTQEEMAQFIGVSERTIRTAYKNIEEIGLIKRKEYYNGLKRIHRIFVYYPIP
jgi:predicted transcriptional regulator